METPLGSPLMVADGVSSANASPEIEGISAVDSSPPTPAVRLPETEGRESNVRLFRESRLMGGTCVEEVEEVEEDDEELEVEDVVDVDELLEVVVDVVEDVEPEGGSASPISTQKSATEDKVKGKNVGEDTPLVAYSALPPSVPPLDPGDRVKPAPAAVETRLGSPTMLTRKAPL